MHSTLASRREPAAVRRLPFGKSWMLMTAKRMLLKFDAIRQCEEDSSARVRSIAHPSRGHLSGGLRRGDPRRARLDR
jgi:hypothetical protein